MVVQLVETAQVATQSIQLPTSLLVSIVIAMIVSPAGAIVWVMKSQAKQIRENRHDDKEARKQRDELVREMNAELRNSATINAQSAAVLAQLSAGLAAVSSRQQATESVLQGGIASSIGEHKATQAMIEALRADLTGKPPKKSGRAHATTIFATAALASAGALAAHEGGEERVAEQVAPAKTYRSAAFAALAAAHPEVLQ